MMGGQSFKCPHCNKWFLEKRALYEHLVGKHDEPKGFRVTGVAEHTKVERG